MTATNGDNPPSISLKEYIEVALKHQTELLNERGIAHSKEHREHEKAHDREHADTKTALLLATSQLDSQLGALEAKLGQRLDVIDSTIISLRSRLDIGPPSLSTLQSRSDENIGRSSGAIEGRALLFSLAGIFMGVMAATIAFIGLIR